MPVEDSVTLLIIAPVKLVTAPADPIVILAFTITGFTPMLYMRPPDA